MQSKSSDDLNELVAMSLCISMHADHHLSISNYGGPVSIQIYRHSKFGSHVFWFSLYPGSDSNSLVGESTKRTQDKWSNLKTWLLYTLAITRSGLVCRCPSQSTYCLMQDVWSLLPQFHISQQSRCVNSVASSASPPKTLVCWGLYQPDLSPDVVFTYFDRYCCFVQLLAFSPGSFAQQ